MFAAAVGGEGADGARRADRCGRRAHDVRRAVLPGGARGPGDAEVERVGPAASVARGRSLPRACAALRHRLGARAGAARAGVGQRAADRRVRGGAAAARQCSRSPGGSGAHARARPRHLARSTWATCSRRPATPGRIRSTSRASSACAAASWTSTRPAPSSRSGSSSSATPSSPFAPTTRRRSARRPRSIRRRSFRCRN